MQLLLNQPVGRFHVRRATPDAIDVADRTITSSFLLAPDALVEAWHGGEIAALDATAAAPILALSPALVLVPGHMLLGVALDAQGQEWAWLETTLLGAPTRRAAGDTPPAGAPKAGLDAAIDTSLASFEAALDAGQRRVDAAAAAFADPGKRDFQIIDIRAARERGVMPIAR